MGTRGATQAEDVQAIELTKGIFLKTSPLCKDCLLRLVEIRNLYETMTMLVQLILLPTPQFFPSTPGSSACYIR
jgi:hypothetical protein